METFVLAVVILLVGAVLYYRLSQAGPASDAGLKEENILLKQERANLEQKTGELLRQLETEKSEKNKFSGENKRMYVEIQELKKDLQVLDTRSGELKEELTKFKSKAEAREVEFKDQINKLQTAQTSLEDEKTRIRKEDAQRLEDEKADRDRMWNEHESEVKRKLTEICKIPEYSFQYYDNTHLPEDFDGKLKPDFMIDFLGQYMIFDPKTSRSDNLQIYIDDQVKKTVEKIRDSALIHKTVFLVVPTHAIESLKKLHYYEQGYTFFIVSPESLMPIISSLKRITSYEFAEKLDPQERENIVNLIAEFDNHISFRNAADIILAQSGANVLNKASQLVPDLGEEVKQKKSKMRLTNLKPNDIKKLMLSTDNQHRAIKNLISPKSEVSNSLIESASEVISIEE